MGKKVVAMFLMCMVIVAAMHMAKVKADDAKFKSCFDDCEKECKDEGKGVTECEMKCDDECEAKQAKEMLGIED